MVTTTLIANISNNRRGGREGVIANYHDTGVAVLIAGKMAHTAALSRESFLEPEQHTAVALP
jgi:hypothetical protein